MTIDFIVMSGMNLRLGCYIVIVISGISLSWIVKSGFCSMHFTVTLAELKNGYIGNIVISKIVISRFDSLMFLHRIHIVGFNS